MPETETFNTTSNTTTEAGMATLSMGYTARDIATDVAGTAGVYGMSVSIVDGTLKLAAGIAGLVLLYWSIKLKIEMVREKRLQNQKLEQEAKDDSDE